MVVSVVISFRSATGGYCPCGETDRHSGSGIPRRDQLLVTCGGSISEIRSFPQVYEDNAYSYLFMSIQIYESINIY
jgi:hypothetical protein